MRKLVLKNHKNEEFKTKIDLDRLGKVKKMMILVIGGDEVLLVTRKDKKQVVYATSNAKDGYNYRYMLYNYKHPDPELLDEFMNREDSMSMKIYAIERGMKQ